MSIGFPKSVQAAWKGLFHQPTGPLTAELLRNPGGFGLGQVPVAETPDATTAMTCGFCSTGCSLTVHLKDNSAIGLSPTTDYPVNLGMACPKGWEALSVLQSDDRARHVLPADESNSSQTWERIGRFLKHGSDRDGGNGFSRQPGQVWHGGRAWGWQYAAMHGDVGGRLQAVVRF